MTATNDTFTTLATTCEGFLRCAYDLDREADVTFEPAGLAEIAAERAALFSAGRVIEGRMDAIDGGKFDHTRWAPAALRAYVECELAADDGGRVAVDAAAALTGGMVPLWLE